MDRQFVIAIGDALNFEKIRRIVARALSPADVRAMRMAAPLRVKVAFDAPPKKSLEIAMRAAREGLSDAFGEPSSNGKFWLFFRGGTRCGAGKMVVSIFSADEDSPDAPEAA